MRRRVSGVLATLSFLMLTGCVTQPLAPPLVAVGGVAVTSDDLRSELRYARAADVQKVLATDDGLATLIEHLYARRRLVEAAGELGYLEREDVQYRVRRDRELLLSTLVPAVYGQEVQLPDLSQQARDYYDAHPDEFTIPEEVRAGHILLQASDAASKKRRRVEADKLVARLRAGEDFGELARKYSEDGSGPLLGDLGFFKRGMMEPEFEAAAFALKAPGELSDVIESPYGLHLIKLTDRKPAKQIPFEDVRERLVGKLERQYRENAVKEWRARLIPDSVAKLPEAELTALLDGLRREFNVAPAVEAAVQGEEKDAASE